MECSSSGLALLAFFWTITLGSRLNAIGMEADASRSGCSHGMVRIDC